MIKRLVVVDVERRRLFVVERAAALEFAARLLELDRFRDQRGQQRAGPKLVEEGSREPHDAAIITICRLRGENAMRRAPGKGQGPHLPLSMTGSPPPPPALRGERTSPAPHR